MSIKLWNAETQTADNLIGSQIENNIIDDTTASTDKVYSSSKVESTVEGCYDHKIKSFTDLNLAIPSSTERIIHFTTFYQPSNRPNTVSNYFNGFSIRDRLTNKYVTQMVLSLDEKAYIRTRLGDNWGDWKQLATTDDVYGTELTANEDLNNILTRKSTSGTAIAQSLINRPSDSSATECCVYFDSCGTSNLYGVQHFVGINAAANTYNEWVRIKNDSSWNAWKKLF